jgi:hypothetical protein
MKTLLSLLATAAGVLATLTMLTLMFAGAANMTPEAYHRHKNWMWFTLLAGLADAALAITLTLRGHPGWGAAIGIFPAVVILSLLIYVSIT